MSPFVKLSLGPFGWLLGCTVAHAACPPPVDMVTQSTTHFIPRDAPIGSLIVSGVVNYDSTRDHTCANRSVVAQMLMGPRIPAIAAANSGSVGTTDIGQHLYQTGVPGVAFGAIKADGRLCDAGGSQIPANQLHFPFSAVSCSSRYQTRVYYYLYKTGDIAPGAHTLNQPGLQVLFNGAVQSSLTLNQTIIVAGCSMPATGSNPLEVELFGSVGNFNGNGSGGPVKEFTIPLLSCVKGNYSTYYPWNYFQGNYANVRFEPSRGSTLLDGPAGIVGLRPESTATGIGVQILKRDMTPVRLGEEVQITHVNDGITNLAFNARYVQVGDTAPTGGTADATVNFTVTFK